MISIRALVGLPVIVNDRRSGRVVRAELSEDLTGLAGLWVTSGFFGTRFIPAECLGTLGSAAVTADHPGRRRKYRSSSVLRRAVGTDGSRIGAITGANIDELSFCVESLELSFGVFDDLLSGRQHIHSFAVNQEKGCVIVDAAKNGRRTHK